MTIGLRLFISSATFAIGIALAYWFTSREIVGTFMLGFMAFALGFVATYMIVAEREANLIGDEREATIEDGAGELVGTYTIRSPLPLAAAAAVTAIGIGIVVSPTIAILALLATIAIGGLFIVQSR
ncbi:MAG: cytochrome c oxidase subunit 4 [Candidatus Eremiobacteraeota bacterium]|nr:cytochrome c oxidase subunit 4 [Candidatus Eremiobacteraeota bacterium]